MGHRAYVAYEQKNGTFSMHYSHWGASDFALCDRITESTPFGGPNDLEPEYLTAFSNMLDGMADEDDFEVAGRIVEKQNEKCVEPEPIKQFIQFEDVIDTIGTDTGIETLYVVEQDFTVHGYTVEMLRIDGETFGNILLRPRDKRGETDEPYDTQHEQGFFAGVRQQLSNLVENGVLSTTEAKEEAIDTIVEWAARRSNRLLAHSTAIPTAVLRDNPRAFLNTTSEHRYFDEMIPVSYGEINSWAIPDELDIPPAFTHIKDEIHSDVAETDTESAEKQTSLTELHDRSDSRVLPDPSDITIDECPNVDVDPDTSTFTRNRVAFTLNGEPYTMTDLPRTVRDVLKQYRKFSRGFNTELTNVYECDACRDRDDGFEYGYLTDSENTDSYKNQYTCNQSWTQFATPQTLHIGGDHAPETWVVHTAFENGDGKRRVSNMSESPTYTVTVSEMEAFRGEDGLIESTTVSVSPPRDCELPDSGVVESYPETTVQGETNGKKWELTARFGVSTLQIEWERVEDGECVEYKYRSPEERAGDKEFIGKTPVTVNDDEHVVVDSLQADGLSTVRKRTCGSTSFTKVWPPNDFQDRCVSVPRVDSDAVPNSSQHLSRIQSGVESLVTKKDVEELIAVTAHQFDETYAVFDGLENTAHDSESMSEVPSGNNESTVNT